MARQQKNAIRSASQNTNRPRKRPSNVGKVSDLRLAKAKSWSEFRDDLIKNKKLPEWEWHDFNTNNNDVGDWFVYQLSKAIPATIAKYHKWFSAIIDYKLMRHEVREYNRKQLNNYNKTEKEGRKEDRKEAKEQKKEDKKKNKGQRKGNKTSLKAFGAGAQDIASEDSRDKRTGATLNGQKNRFTQLQQRISGAREKAKQLIQKTGNKIRAARGARTNRGNDGR